MNRVISQNAIERRKYWIDEIDKLSGNFANDFERLESELHQEIEGKNLQPLLDHLRLSGDIPEQYGHDSSEEKLYSKYTDSLLAQTFTFLGLKAAVLTERADAADVDVFATNFSFVADAKAFRLSRTAKNQKDFKIQAMDNWKRGKPYAMVVCPIYQLPARSSQIYEQAISREVLVFTYSHLAMLARYAENNTLSQIEGVIGAVFKAVNLLNPSKDANAYWAAVNGTMLSCDSSMRDFWHTEKLASLESIQVG